MFAQGVGAAMLSGVGGPHRTGECLLFAFVAGVVVLSCASLPVLVGRCQDVWALRR